MLRYQYHCACCDHTVNADAHTCPNCGSHQIKSPFGFWIFCILTCLALVIALKLVHAYLQHDQPIVPEQQSLFEVLTFDHNKTPES
ncbi:hypothetical protein [Acinetobacter sp. B51(2017)]|uniref:hypothetical protein n=1 Tax=Acinetobacter sp. B51(2017) TaxID=2060938 RepID=UPI00148D1DEC|nr:hypothetical protein [Acinetobacter sp. B51(2017)]